MFTATPNQRLKRTQSADLFAVALLFLVCAAFYLPRLTGPISAQDEGILLTYPDLILTGLVPYRDFAALYTPGGLYVVALAFSVFGESVLVERAVGLLYWCSMAMALYFTGRPVSRLTGWVAACAVVIGLTYFPVGAYAMVGAMALALGGLLAGYRSYGMQDRAAQGRLALLAGVGAGAAAWFRHDVGLVVSIALFFMFLTGPQLRLRRFLAGLLVAGIPLAAYLFAVGRDAAFESLVLDVLRNAPGRKLPVQPSVSLFVLFVVVAMTVAVAVIAHVEKFAAAERALLRGAAILSLALVPAVLQRADGWHILYVASPVLGLAAIGLGVVMKHRLPGFESLRLSATGVACIALALATLAGFSAWRVKPTLPLVSGERFVYLTSQASVETQAMVDEVNRIARPGQRIFVGPNDLRYTNYNDSYLYFLLPQLAPSSRYLEMNPGVGNREGSGMAGQLATADLVVLNTSYDNWREPNGSSIAGSDHANRVMDDQFCEHRSFGRWRILLRCRTPR